MQSLSNAIARRLQFSRALAFDLPESNIHRDWGLGESSSSIDKDTKHTPARESREIQPSREYDVLPETTARLFIEHLLDAKVLNDALRVINNFCN